MSEAHHVVMRPGGQLVIPPELRARAGLTEGTPLVLLETEGAVVVLTRQQLMARVRADLTGLDLTGELLAERRIAATDEDSW